MKNCVPAVLLILCGCSLVPTWVKHPFRTPVQSAQKADAKFDTARKDLEERVIGNVEAAGYAISKLPDSREKAVATDFLDEAKQWAAAHGVVVGQTELVRLRTMVDGLLSENVEIRKQASKDRAALTEKLADASEELTKRAEEKVKWEAKEADYIKTQEHQAGLIRTLFWVVAFVIGALVIYQLIHFLAMFYPPLASVSAGISAILTPVHAIEAAVKAKISKAPNGQEAQH